MIGKFSYTKHKLIINLLSFVHLIFLLGVSASLAESLPVRVKIVKVTEEGEERPVSGVESSLLPHKTGPSVGKEKTNKSGIATFEGVRPGTYIVRCSSKHFRKNPQWALPNYNGPYKVSAEDNMIKIKCLRAAKVSGKIVCDKKNIELANAIISAPYSTIKSVNANKNGEFVLSGVHPDRPLIVFIMLRDYKNNFVPLYQKKVKIKKENLKSKKETSLGQIQFPSPKNNQGVKLHIVNESGNSVKSKEIMESGSWFMIQNKRIEFRASPPVVASVSDKLLKLPIGDYKLWWIGHKESKIWEVSVTKSKTKNIKIKIP